MKLLCTRVDGRTESIELVGPVGIIAHPGGTMDIIHDEGTGLDYWFDKANGYFDGTGVSVKAHDLTTEEAKALLNNLAHMCDAKPEN